MEVTRTAERDLDEQLAREIVQLQQAAFPRTAEFAYQRWHHTPPSSDDAWLTARESGRLVGSVRVVRRRIATAAGERTVGGVANVCSHPRARGRGAATACLRAAQEYIAGDGRMDFGLLFCGKGVLGFYAKFGWRAIDNPVVVTGADGERALTHARDDQCSMICPGRKATDEWPEGEIDLNGPDW